MKWLPNMAESLVLRGELVGHAGWVTSISTPLDPNSDIILSSSRCDTLEHELAFMCTNSHDISAENTVLDIIPLF